MLSQCWRCWFGLIFWIRKFHCRAHLNEIIIFKFPKYIYNNILEINEILTCFIVVPRDSWSIVRTIWLWRTWGSWNTSFSGLTGPYGNFAPSKISFHSLLVLICSWVSIIWTNSILCFTLNSLVRNFGCNPRLSNSNFLHKSLNCPSLPQPIIDILDIICL